MRVRELIELLKGFEPELFVEFEFWDSDEGNMLEDVDDARLIPPTTPSYVIKKTGEERTLVEAATVRLS